MVKQKDMNDKKPMTIIGRTSTADFPAENIRDVPVKIDTGADSSSIWATNIREHDGVLIFSLFGPQSSLYTGEEITSKHYTVVSVKNSFGRTEFRYKVMLSCIIAGRRIKVRFTLANRANSTMPILIGRRTLAGKFLVDVAHRDESAEPQRMLLLSQRYSANVRTLVAAVSAQLEGAEVDYATYDDVSVSFRDGVMSAQVETTGRDIASYDIVHFKTSLTRDITAALARYAEYNGVKVIDDAVKSFPTTSKLYEYALLAQQAILVPNSYFRTPAAMTGSYDTFVAALGSPFVLKDIHGSKGNYNEVIRSAADYEKFCRRAASAEVYLIGQAFIPNNGDYRVLVTAKKIALVIYRERQDASTHLNNTSQGGKATLIKETELPQDVRIDCARAADAMGRDIAGVDMMQDAKTGTWYCLEVNDGPQIATGAFLAEKQTVFADYITRELEKRV